MSEKPLRLAMPHTAAFVDAFREAFGRPEIDEQVRGGMQGCPTFWARENGQEIGTRAVDRGPSFDGNEMVLQIPIEKDTNHGRR
jgi:hypothetical protein